MCITIALFIIYPVWHINHVYRNRKNYCSGYLCPRVCDISLIFACKNKLLIQKFLHHKSGERLTFSFLSLFKDTLLAAYIMRRVRNDRLLIKFIVEREGGRKRFRYLLNWLNKIHETALQIIDLQDEILNGNTPKVIQ
jgi:hypothetical protein